MNIIIPDYGISTRGQERGAFDSTKIPLSDKAVKIDTAVNPGKHEAFESYCKGIKIEEFPGSPDKYSDEFKKIGNINVNELSSDFKVGDADN